jgi:Cell division protein CrgA
MPESRVRRKAAFTAPPPKSAGPTPNPRWYAPLMVALMVVGLAYVVVYYLSQALYPVPQLGAWNIAVGFGVMMAGFAMTTKWR